jgi:hypothetical protein
MSLFDFISGDKFRLSLESDYQELQSAMQVEAYKAVHVLAGSIVEVDCTPLTTPLPKSTSPNPCCILQLSQNKEMQHARQTT